ncbi:transcriptional regulator [Kitasatospora sp. NPDC058046]|uniref:transcriptional regulator n=1 Tax=Kitasatospora sp. NPDC058046 TaxID=3346312 RepID=UPI0036DDA380
MIEPSAHPLVHIRRQRDWGQSKLAVLLRERGRKLGKNLGTNRTTIWKWETWKQAPDDVAQEVLADLLGVPQEHVKAGGWPDWLPVWEVSVLAAPWSEAGAVRALTDLLRSGHMDRRGFLTITGATLAGLASNWAAAPGAAAAALGGDRVTEQLVESVEQRVTALRSLDEQMGGARLLEHARGDFALITGLLDNGTYTGEVGRRLYGLASRVSYLTGWMAYDAGLRSAGQQYYVGALRSSDQAGDRAFGAFILAEMGVHVGDAGDTKARVDLIETAADGAPSGLAPITQSFLQLHRAEALSRHGRHRAAAAALKSSVTLWDRADRADRPDWLHWYGESQISSTEGKVLLRGGQPGNATRSLEASIAAAVPRDRAVRAPRLAQARLAGGNLDGALDAALQSVALLEGPVTSDRAVTRVTEFSKSLEKYAAVPAVRDFRERVRALDKAA